MAQDFSTGNPPPAKKGFGLWKGLGCGCVVMLLVCGGGIGVITWKGKDFIDKSMSKDPVVIRQISGEVADVTLPPEFMPLGSINGKIPFVGISLKGAAYQGKDPNTIFMMGEMPGGNPEQVGEQLRQALQKDQSSTDTHQKVIESKTEELTIRGKPATVVFKQMLDESTKKESWQVVGEFTGKEGPAMLMLLAPKDAMDKAKIDAILSSIK
jgi:hypothetical protein